MQVKLDLLGIPKVRVEQHVQNIPLNKPSSLLLYLASRSDWVSRSELAALYRPDVPELEALKYLRKLVFRAKQYDWAKTFEVTELHLRWHVQTDLQAFRQAYQEKNWQVAIDLYQSELLEELKVSDSEDYDSWLKAERSELEQQWQHALWNRVEELKDATEFDKALGLLALLYRHDPLNEDIVQAQLRLLANAKRYQEALNLYDSFCKELKEEFDADPLESTKALIEELQQEEIQQGSTHATAVKQVRQEVDTTKHNLPHEMTRFVGREQEVLKVKDILRQESCRLLTLIAPGGMGKTRLALAVAYEQLKHYKDGIYFVSLAEVLEPDQMLYAITNALGLFTKRQDIKADLLAYLQTKEILLVLDNLEHLTEAVPLIDELLEAAPSLTVLATSRVQLQLQAEWLFDLMGLNYPENENWDLTESYDALELFIQTAKRFQVELSSRDLKEVARICQRVEGMPLAIKLAAGWLRTLPVKKIYQEIEKGIDLLETTSTDVPDRHKSMHAVFDYSWQLLSPGLQDILMKASVFRQGFGREAAQAIMGASTRHLLELISKSLIRRQATGRFDLHPLVQQYAAEQLSKDSTLERDTIKRYGEFYLTYLKKLNEVYQQGKTAETLGPIDRERSNIETTWLWALDDDLDKLCELSGLVEDYYAQRVRLQEGVQLYQSSLEKLDENQTEEQMAMGIFLTHQGWLFLRMGQIAQAERNGEKAKPLLQPSGATPHLAALLNLLGSANGMKGQQEKAKSYFEKAIEIAQTLKDKRLEVFYMNNLAITEKQLGNFRYAETLYRQTLKLGRQQGQDLSVVRNLLNLALLLASAEEVKNLHEAKACYEEGLQLARKGGFEQVEPLLIEGLGGVMLELEDYEQAQTFFEQALTLNRQSKATAREAITLTSLSNVAIKLGDLIKAKQLLREGLELSHQTGSARATLRILAQIAKFNALKENWQDFYQLSSFVLQQQATDSTTRESVKSSLKTYQDKLEQSSIYENVEDMELTNLDEAVALVLLSF